MAEFDYTGKKIVTKCPGCGKEISAEIERGLDFSISSSDGTYVYFAHLECEECNASAEWQNYYYEQHCKYGEKNERHQLQWMVQKDTDYLIQ